MEHLDQLLETQIAVDIDVEISTAFCAVWEPACLLELSKTFWRHSFYPVAPATEGAERNDYTRSWTGQHVQRSEIGTRMSEDLRGPGDQWDPRTVEILETTAEKVQKPSDL